MALIPQASIAIGLIFQLSQLDEVAIYKNVLINTVIGSTIIFEILGPLTAKIAFKKANEIST